MVSHQFSCMFISSEKIARINRHFFKIFCYIKQYNQINKRRKVTGKKVKKQRKGRVDSRSTESPSSGDKHGLPHFMPTLIVVFLWTIVSSQKLGDPDHLLPAIRRRVGIQPPIIRKSYLIRQVEQEINLQHF